MKVILLVIGKTDATYLQEGIAEYQKRLKHYAPFELKVIPDIKRKKNLTEYMQKKREAELILHQLNNTAEVILLDEKGKSFSSKDFSSYIEKKMVSGIKELVFIIGGPYGFAKEVYDKAQQKISLSRMTFSHQMARLVFMEQLYRAFTILKGEPYHHD
ncbi:23S rRNA (pseudouridine(1915)-N(3))-methyltransferase [hydrothermal vent metagenome]|uniref:23S rRNA (Pseudouridine(1915)-N(3))-methyltransferase n=1 Tax=hydrothermal vent metagenome TaxID=652676 RepID=A0A3B0UGH8_9ZZZZ